MTLDSLSGILQTDGHSCYKRLFERGDVVHVGGFAHARRKFFEARKELPKEVENILSKIGKLYAILWFRHFMLPPNTQKWRLAFFGLPFSEEGKPKFFTFVDAFLRHSTYLEMTLPFCGGTKGKTSLQV